MCCYETMRQSIVRDLLEAVHDTTPQTERETFKEGTLAAEIKPIESNDFDPYVEGSILRISVSNADLKTLLERERFGAVIEATAIEIFDDVMGVEVYLAPVVEFFETLEKTAHSH